MQLFQKVLGFGSSNKEMVDLWTTYFRSVLEHYCNIWGSSLTEENKKGPRKNPENIQQTNFGEKYTTYKKACKKLFLESLEEKRRKKYPQICKTEPII